MRVNLHSLRVKLLLSLVFLFAFFTAVSLITNLVAMRIIRRQAVESMTTMVAQTDRYLSLLFRKAMDLSYVLSVNANLKTLCNSEEELRSSPYRLYEALDGLDKDLMYNADMNVEARSIYLYVEPWNKVITTMFGMSPYQWVAETAWMKRALEGPESAGRWEEYRDVGFGGQHLISFFCRLDLVNRALKNRAWMSVNFTEESVYATLQGLKLTGGSQVWMIDGEGRIASGADKSLIGAPILDIVPLPPESLKGDGFQVRTALSGQPQEVVFQRLSLTGWGILAAVPESELLREQSFFRSISIALIAAVFLFLAFYAWRIVLNDIDRSVARLVDGMQRSQRGDFDYKIPETKPDEFGFLFASYNEMMRRIRLLIRELYEEKLSRRESELKVLQSQINPHFLYNILETINWLAQAGKTPEISRIVLSLSTLYRTAFNRGRESIDVTEMLQGAESYLVIQKYRYKNLAGYAIEADEDARDWLVLNLLLQPVVENAVIHGIGELERPGTVRIRCSRGGHVLSIRVKDDGEGMDGEKLSLLRESLESRTSSEDSGLRNVQRRIRLFYGEEYGLRVESAPGRGTEVEIRVPVYSPVSIQTMSRNSVGETPTAFLNTFAK